MYDGHLGRPLTFSNAAFHKNCAFLFIKNVRNDLLVRARFNKSRGCMKPKICAANNQAQWIEIAIFGDAEYHPHLEQDVERHVGHVFEASSATTNGLWTRRGICRRFTETGIASGFGLCLDFLAWRHGESAGTGDGDGRSDARKEGARPTRTRLAVAVAVAVATTFCHNHVTPPSQRSQAP